MSIHQIHYETLKQGSKTYFNTARFFPEDIREDLFILYGFLHVAENFIDESPMDHQGFKTFYEAYRRSVNGTFSGDPIIDDFVNLKRRRHLRPEWIRQLFNSLECQLNNRGAKDKKLEYLYETSEAIGLLIGGILRLPKEASESCRMHGRVIGYINMVKHLPSDCELKKRYLPFMDDYSDYSFYSDFFKFHQKQIQRYRAWQIEAAKGYRYIPYRYLVAVKTVSDMNLWSAKKIETNPEALVNGNVEPPKKEIIKIILRNIFLCLFLSRRLSV